MPFLPLDRSQQSTLESKPDRALTSPGHPPAQQSVALPPYTLAAAPFRFRGLIALAERLPLGGEREVVLAAFLGARLTWDGASEDFAESQLQRSRATHARTWLQTLALSSNVKAAFLSLFDALAAGEKSQLMAGWDRVSVAINRVLDAPARSDIKAVTARLARTIQANQ